MERESFKSRLGFILLSAGCAIGIGNVWRIGETGTEVALVGCCSDGRKLSADDVLYNGCRMDAALFYLTVTGKFEGRSADQVGGIFEGMLGQAGIMTFWMLLTLDVIYVICSLLNGIGSI